MISSFRFGTVYLCGAFWKANMLGTDSKVSAHNYYLVQESSTVLTRPEYRQEPSYMRHPILPSTEGPTISLIARTPANRLHIITLHRR